MKCSCGTEKNFSIHGNCNKCGRSAPRAYNGVTQEPQLPTTARGRRRRANKTNKNA